MQQPTLVSIIESLSPEQQVLVEKFIKTLKENSMERPTFREALDSFKTRHPELLHLLSQ